MKLYMSATSPYARLAAAVIIEKGLQDRVQRIMVDPWASGPEILAANPISRIPTLITDKGVALTESLLIADYLDRAFPQPPLLPAHSLETTLRKAGLAQGVIDSAIYIVSTRRFGLGPDVADPLHTRRLESIRRALPVLARELGAAKPQVDLGDLAVAVALGYLSFRFPEIDWRGEHRTLAHWYERVAARPALAQTQPPT